MPALPLTFFLRVRYWVVNWKYSYSDSLMKDQGEDSAGQEHRPLVMEISSQST